MDGNEARFGVIGYPVGGSTCCICFICGISGNSHLWFRMIGSRGRNLHAKHHNLVRTAYSGFASLVHLLSMKITCILTQPKPNILANHFPWMNCSPGYFTSLLLCFSFHLKQSSSLRPHNAPTFRTMSKPLARRIPDDVWESYKVPIGDLYIGEDRKLDGHEGVMDVMTRRYGFSPTYVFTRTNHTRVKLTHIQ